MIEWEGYRLLSSATWETKEHVTPYLMAEYDGPHMSDVGLTHEAVCQSDFSGHPEKNVGVWKFSSSSNVLSGCLPEKFRSKGWSCSHADFNVIPGGGVGCSWGICQAC